MMRFRMFMAGLILLCCYGAAFAQTNPADWPMFGQNPSNTANNSSETTISTANVSQLQVKWSFTPGGDVSARAAVVNGVAYFPDWGGNLWALNASTGAVIWSRQLSSYGLSATTRSRTTPAVVNGKLYLGTQEGAWLLAINAATGALLWKTQIESPANDPFAIITTSPAVANDFVYVGVASLEEGMAAFIPGFQCCKARGSVASVNANNGKIRWKIYTTPEGYSGAGVWGSNLAVDADKSIVYVSTGNNYSRPKPSAKSSIPGVNYGDCIAGLGTTASCNAPDNYVDAVLALSTGNGKITWAQKLVNWNQFGVTDGSDNWNVDCLFGNLNSNCPTEAGPDYDFGSAPNLITYQTTNGPKTILGAGQKSGIYFAFDPKTGAILWQTQVGPGSALGGMEWGSATDGQRIYVQIANFYGIPSPSGGNAGSWAALDPATGAILWHKPDPNNSVVIGPMTVANGVVYASSMSGAATAPTMFALNAATGMTIWSHVAGSSVNAGATVVNGTVFWGSGYTNLGIPGFTGGPGVAKFYAFSLSGH